MEHRIVRHKITQYRIKVHPRTHREVNLIEQSIRGCIVNVEHEADNGVGICVTKKWVEFVHEVELGSAGHAVDVVL